MNGLIPIIKLTTQVILRTLKLVNFQKRWRIFFKIYKFFYHLNFFWIFARCSSSTRLRLAILSFTFKIVHIIFFKKKIPITRPRSCERKAHKTRAYGLYCICARSSTQRSAMADSTQSRKRTLCCKTKNHCKQNDNKNKNTADKEFDENSDNHHCTENKNKNNFNNNNSNSTSC